MPRMLSYTSYSEVKSASNTALQAQCFAKMEDYALAGKTVRNVRFELTIEKAKLKIYDISTEQ
ncbi:MAG: hypothetical protein EOM50_20845 [Erysipelotrichia bacterium]|nr:hypothetical protein [Erysipelotrichia bacterium]